MEARATWIKLAWRCLGFAICRLHLDQANPTRPDLGSGFRLSRESTRFFNPSATPSDVEFQGPATAIQAIRQSQQPLLLISRFFQSSRTLRATLDRPVLRAPSAPFAPFAPDRWLDLLTALLSTHVSYLPRYPRTRLNSDLHRCRLNSRHTLVSDPILDRLLAA